MRFVPAKFLGRQADKSRVSLFSQGSIASEQAAGSSRLQASASKRESRVSEQFYPVFRLSLFLPSAVCNASVSTEAISDHTHLHTALYVQTNSLSNTGYVHHVVGSICSPAGLAYAWQPFTLPDQPRDAEVASASSPVRGNEELGDLTLVNTEWVGFTAKEGYPEHWETVLRREVPVPGWQVSLNPGTGKDQRIRRLGDGHDGAESQVVEWWDSGEGPEVVGCKDWVEMGGIPVLESRGLIVKGAV
jgi:hypothetical protein